MSTVVRVPENSNVLVVDDNPVRLAWFRARLANVKLVETTTDAIEALKTETFGIAFLDHDLGPEDYELYVKGQTRRVGNGQEIARWMLDNNRIPDVVVIHSWNPDGANAMKDILPKAHVIPFGDFKIAVEAMSEAEKSSQP